MSALRSLCQVSRIALRSRLVSGMRVSALAAPRAAMTVTPAVRAFSGSARRLGSGACMFHGIFFSTISDVLSSGHPSLTKTARGAAV